MNRLGQMLIDEGMEKGIEKAMNTLEVPEDKREKYRQTIVSNN